MGRKGQVLLHITISGEDLEALAAQLKELALANRAPVDLLIASWALRPMGPTWNSGGSKANARTHRFHS